MCKCVFAEQRMWCSNFLMHHFPCLHSVARCELGLARFLKRPSVLAVFFVSLLNVTLHHGYLCTKQTMKSTSEVAELCV